MERNQVPALAQVWRKRINSPVGAAPPEVRRCGGVKPPGHEVSRRMATLRAAGQMSAPPSSSGSGGKMEAVNTHPDVSVCTYLFTHSHRGLRTGAAFIAQEVGDTLAELPQFRPQQSTRLAWLLWVDQAGAGRTIGVTMKKKKAFLHLKWKLLKCLLYVIFSPQFLFLLSKTPDL